MTDTDLGPVSGADKEFEGDDPMELVGVAYPVTSGVESDRELARCFVEEYALVGWSPARIRQLFCSPLYEGPYGIASRHGMGLVDEILADVFGQEVR
ncbi:MAG: hypothetical protein R3320_02150 [Nitriliruptorales bacterium]|nr:hypothetical protein [Nitriliruptorales bacterium]